MNAILETFLVVDQMNPCEDVINRAAEVLASGGLVAAPTDTRYGLLARVDSDLAVANLVNLKGRKTSQPIALFVKDISEAARLAKFDETSLAIANIFLPGPVTLVLPSLVDWPPPLVVNGKIGIRVPNSPLIHALVTRLKVPLTATSANKSGHQDVETVHELRETFSSAISLYLDSGPLSAPASTVVESVGDNMRVLREGAVTRAAILEGIKQGRA